ncbi:hypothetical protein FBQ96_04135 [Nitrospirales bacterium NOB]|nr:MAG: bNR repeat protein [Nitrospira sp. OLB3]MBV6470088.1 Ycf48-like protein [Nitrospirota bacterium]MCE7964983.1 hypothetical protein [Nitrospira sp. NTP2]MDL1888763.1 hypothetical protein [Nitrospirales bacterium NOB]RIK59106.1 MAG: hypothetical protein DCC63_08250 [Nitrospira sp.]
MVRSPAIVICRVPQWLGLPRCTLLVLGLLLLACGKQEAAVVSIALHPSNPNILYIATNEAVHKSRDGGQTWEQFPNFSARRVTTLAIDPKLPATVYAGTMGDAVYKSPDGGQHWLPHNVGLKEHVSFVNEIIFHPENTELIYLATTVGAFVSKNGGREWEERMAGMKEVHIVTCIALDPAHPRLLYAGTTGGTYRSDDGGNSWQKVNRGLIPEDVLNAAMALGVNVLVVDPTNPDVIYAGTTKGLFRTGNRAESWETIGQGLADQFVSTLILHPSIPGTMYVGGPAGVYETTDGGKTWHAQNEGLASLNVRTLAISPLDPHVLYAGTNGSGLYRSTDGGAHWVPVPLTARPAAHRDP